MQSQIDVVALLADARGRLRKIANAKKMRRFAEFSEVNYYWCRMFLRGGIPNPGIFTIDNLVQSLDEWERQNVVR